MTVGIDIRVLAKEARTGVEDYLINLLSRLLNESDGKIKYKLFYSGFKKFKPNHPWLKNKNVKIKKIKIPNRIFDLILRFFNFPKIDKLLGGVDVFISPHFLITPLSKSARRIMIFYDLSFLRFPEFFSWQKRLWHKLMFPRKQAIRAHSIIAISNSTKEDLINLYKINSQKIKVVYPGIDAKFKPIKDEAKLKEVKDKYQLPENFILYFGTIEPRKNIISLIEAFEEIKKEKQGKILDVSWHGFEGIVKGSKEEFFDFSKLKLIIAGEKGWLYREVFEKAQKSDLRNDIIFTGFIEEDDKSYLYNLAKIFIYPSFFEGFGLPPLEAMACGTPVIVSNKSSLSEVVGDSAITINPENPNEISWAIREILENQKLSDYLSEKGRERSRQFNWDKAVEEILRACE